MSDQPGAGNGFDRSLPPIGGLPEPAPSLEVHLNGLRFPTPVLAASGCFNVGRELGEIVDLERVGGIVTKSVTLRPRKGLPVPRMAETASGMLNAIGLQNIGVDEFRAKDAPWIESLRDAGTPVLVSVAGRTVDEYAQVTVRVGGLAGVTGIEANISCPNVERRNQVFACHPDQAAEVIGTMCRLTAVPVFAKLTADVTNIVDVAEACVRAGAHGLSLVNTLLGMAIDTETFRPKLGAVTGGLSGPAMKPVALRCVYQVAQAFPEVPIMGIGGIRTAEDAVEFLLAGASAVQVGTASFFDPQAIVTVADGIGGFLARRGMSSPADLRGKVVNPERVPEPAHRGG